MQIYIHKEDQDFGPYSEEQARGFLETGVFHDSDYGWREGLEEWQPVRDLLGPAPAKNSAPAVVPVPSFAVSPPRIPLAKTYEPSATQPVLRKPIKVQEKKPASRAMMAINLVLVLVALAAADIRFGNGGPFAQRALAVLHAKASTLSGNVEARAAAISNTPASSVAPAPLPTQASISLNPAELPKTVMLKEAAVFPAVYNSQVVGSVTVPSGTLVQLVGVSGNDVELVYRGGGKRVPRSQTDLDQRMPRS